MKLTIDRVALLDSLALVQGIADQRSVVPILSHVLLEPELDKLKISATNLTIGIKMEIVAETIEPAPFTISARKLFEIARDCEGEKVSITALDYNQFQIICERARFKTLGLDLRSFPTMPSLGDKVSGKLTLPATELVTMIDKTIFATYPDASRHNLYGVWMGAPVEGTVRMVATDGHRLSMIERDAPGFSMETGVIIPRKGLIELRKLLKQAEESEVQLIVNKQLTWLRHGTTELSTQLVEGEFPDYEAILPKQPIYEVHTNNNDLFNAIRRASIFLDGRFYGLKFTFTNNALTIASTNPDLSESSETLDIIYNGSELSTTLNARYVQDVLNVIPDEDEIILSLNDDTPAYLITTPSDPRYQYVVMPMKQ